MDLIKEPSLDKVTVTRNSIKIILRKLERKQKQKIERFIFLKLEFGKDPHCIYTMNSLEKIIVKFMD